MHLTLVHICGGIGSVHPGACARIPPSSAEPGRRVMIRASCHTADNRLALEFDATPWFREADPHSIRHLAKQGWSSVWIAGALEARPSYEGLHRPVDYAATRLREESLGIRRKSRAGARK